MRMLHAAEEVQIPREVEVKIEGGKVYVKGPKGSLVRDFSHTPINLRLEKDRIILEAYYVNKKEGAVIGTLASHVRNMIKGVLKGFTYKLKIAYAHFPISVKVKEDKIIIENFQGERKPRVAKIAGDVKVEVKGDEITVQGINIEEVGQTAANIQQATLIKGYDPRVFQDGIYIYSRE